MNSPDSYFYIKDIPNSRHSVTPPPFFGKEGKFQSLPVRQAGFTLIEVMVSVAILAFGITAIYEAILTSLNIFGSYTKYLNTQAWINEQIWEAQDRVNHSRIVIVGENKGVIRLNNKDHEWTMQIDPLDMDAGLYALNIRLAWQEGGRTITLSRGAYAVPARVMQE
jgi:prepilin-type N-terminal cleavage/methylation domain-containing protein